jgi:SAM-dependent methyltransferase
MSPEHEQGDPDDRPTRVENAQPERDVPDWPAFYRHTIGREPRPLFVKGVSLARAAGVRPGLAVEIGFGDGTETLALLADGWRVLAVDPTPEARDVLLARVPSDAEDRLEVRTRSADGLDLPRFDLIYAGFALSFLERQAFGRFWTEVRAAVRPGGFIVVNVFGEKDTWAGDAYMTFATRAEVERMVAGLEVLALDEEDADGTSFVGDKHWHVFDIVARRPPA